MSNPFEVVARRSEAYAWLRFGEIVPRGWIQRQMRRDLETGVLGCLDELVPTLIREDDIYGRDRLTNTVRRKELGVISPDAEWQVMYLWWNSETQSNWWDGLVRTALLLDHEQALERVRAYVDRILATQDADGYMGIYAPDLRYSFTGENGELWAQATLFRALLGYYEATGEARVLSAIERAAQVTMGAYPPGGSQPFPAETTYCGDAHGLAFTDVLERLSQLTGNPAYERYGAWLYEAYSMSGVCQDDAQHRRLIDRTRPFQAHGVHTYEHLRSLVLAAYVTGNPGLEEALEAYLAKLERCLAPSGGPIGDEYIGGRDADASETGYEYCSIHELLHSYTHLLQKSGATTWADRAEWLLFNAGQGARHPTGCGIAYLKTDNSTAMTGTLHPEDRPGPEGPQTRYKYSPAHQDVAVCCVPNAGRIYPYFVRAMWMRSARGLVAMLYGPCEVRTEVFGIPVTIREETNYPFDLEVTFTIETQQPVAFELAFRTPGWAGSVQVDPGGERCEPEKPEPGLLCLRRTWHSGDRVTLRMHADVQLHPAGHGESFLSYGPLVFARPISARHEKGRVYAAEIYPDGRFADVYAVPTGGDEVPAAVDSRDAARFRPSSDPFDVDWPWGDERRAALTLVGDLVDPRTGRRTPARLAPLGGTVLRQVTFPLA